MAMARGPLQATMITADLAVAVAVVAVAVVAVAVAVVLAACPLLHRMPAAVEG